jgi:hypothetical protein
MRDEHTVICSPAVFELIAPDAELLIYKVFADVWIPLLLTKGAGRLAKESSYLAHSLTKMTGLL